MFQHLLIEHAKRTKHITTLSANNSNWITAVTESGLQVETTSSKEKHANGQKDQPYDTITLDFLLTAWEEFISVRTASAKDFVKTKGRSSFLMAFFSTLPFVTVTKQEQATAVRLKEYTTDQMPETTLDQALTLLDDIIHNNLDPKFISEFYQEEKMKRLKSGARQGLVLLGFLTKHFEQNRTLLQAYIAAPDQTVVLREQLRLGYFNVILDILPLVTGLNKEEKCASIVDVTKLLVRNSRGDNLIVDEVAKKRVRNILQWLEKTHLIDHNWNLIDYTYKPTTEISKLHETPPPYIGSDADLIAHIHSYLTSKGFYYEKEEVINFFLSLKTKPFVILSGISGTGKTKLVQWFAESIGAAEENGQFMLIPVRPDWNDGSDLLGYTDIKGEFKQGPLTELIKRALGHPDKPYFVLLDEMNLARVEHYFSDVLSIMESRRWQDGQLVTSPLLSEAAAGQSISLPPNVYIIGTVNMDETTYPFSKKVLDRANTIEFNRIQLDNLSFLTSTEETAPIQAGQRSFVSQYLHLKDLYAENPTLVEQVTAELVAINKLLERIHAHVGYRVRDEICFYMAYNESNKLLSFDAAFDHCLLQKILPRIAGSDTRVHAVLEGLYTACTNMIMPDENAEEQVPAYAKYPKSTAKIYDMRRRLLDDGFTSFFSS